MCTFIAGLHVQYLQDCLRQRQQQTVGARRRAAVWDSIAQQSHPSLWQSRLTVGTLGPESVLGATSASSSGMQSSSSSFTAPSTSSWEAPAASSTEDSAVSIGLQQQRVSAFGRRLAAAPPAAIDVDPDNTAPAVRPRWRARALRSVPTHAPDPEHVAAGLASGSAANPVLPAPVGSASSSGARADPVPPVPARSARRVRVSGIVEAQRREARAAVLRLQPSGFGRCQRYGCGVAHKPYYSTRLLQWRLFCSGTKRKKHKCTWFGRPLRRDEYSKVAKGYRLKVESARRSAWLSSRPAHVE